MNRRIVLDILVPLVYVGAVATMIAIGSGTGAAAVGLIGAFCVLLYFAGVRKNVRRHRNDRPPPLDAMPHPPTGTPPSQTAWSPHTQQWGDPNPLG